MTARPFGHEQGGRGAVSGPMKLLTADETAHEIAEWMRDALERIGNNDIDESVLEVFLTSCVIELSARRKL